MPRLVAIAAAGADFAHRLLAAWDAGDAVLPVDPRLPPPAVARLLAATRPHAMVDVSGEASALDGGQSVEPGDALVVATSGTTGEPRGVVLTHGAVRASAEAVHARLAVDPRQDRWLACLPLAHVGGLSVVTRALVSDTPVTVHDGFVAGDVIRAAREGATLVSLVPTALGRVDAGLFRAVVLGGAAAPDERPANVIASYGMTETASGVVYDGVPLGGVEVRVAANGEVWLRGPMLLRCYRDGVDPRDGEGWFATGDAGELHGGKLTVFGRMGDVIVTGGEKVWPDAVEATLRRHPAVAEVAVAGRPDPEWGTRTVAYVVVSPGADIPTLEELRDTVRAELPAYAAPKEVVIVPELPKTALGKVRRDALGRF